MQRLRGSVVRCSNIVKSEFREPRLPSNCFSCVPKRLLFVQTVHDAADSAAALMRDGDVHGESGAMEREKYVHRDEREPDNLSCAKGGCSGLNHRLIAAFIFALQG